MTRLTKTGTTPIETRLSRTSRGTVVAIAFAAGLVAARANAGPAPAAEPVAETAPAAPVPEEKAASEHHLRVRLLGTGAIVDGDSAQFQQQHRFPDNISGGIDEFHYDTEIGEDTTLQLDGRAIFDNHDYLLRLRLEKEDKAYLDFGYRQFRTWYDGRGGYFPPSNTSFLVFNPERGLDRGEAWANGKFVLPDGFKLTVGYR